MDEVKIVECPRDAWQGLPKVIPTEVKVEYLRKLIEAGFRHIDAVSFVSPRHVPQMADSEEVMQALSAARCLDGNGAAGAQRQGPEMIGIIVNETGFKRALATSGVTTIGYPHSISERFLRQNANTSEAESRALVEKLHRALDGSARHGTKRQLVVYVSMAFGNPYGEPWNFEMVAGALRWLREIGIKTVSLADTVGTASPEGVGGLFRAVKEAAGGIELGVHLHSRVESAGEKVLAAYEGGCRRFDCALTGLGGCPFAGDELVGNIPTEIVVRELAGRGVRVGLDAPALSLALEATRKLRYAYAR